MKFFLVIFIVANLSACATSNPQDRNVHFYGAASNTYNQANVGLSLNV
ncbi:MAG: hypothetical protein JKY13_02070 [Gammaproteobacteria bacterium]|nr:hypothetical protein [Gammaproteobacteria bacterium]